MKDLKYRLDRKVFQAMSFEEPGKQINNSTNLSQEDRINHFNYLMSVASFFRRAMATNGSKGFRENKTQLMGTSSILT